MSLGKSPLDPREALRNAWHQRLEHMDSRRVSDMRKYTIGTPNLPRAPTSRTHAFSPCQWYAQVRYWGTELT
jgi:hypothetical protein